MIITDNEDIESGFLLFLFFFINRVPFKINSLKKHTQTV